MEEMNSVNSESAGAVSRASQVLGHATSIMRGYRRTYIALNLAYYGTVAVAMVFVAFHPFIQQALIESVALSFSEGPLASVAEAYTGGNVFEAGLLTFAVNFFAGTVVVLFVPSLLIPFGGVGIGLVRATLWGLLLAPTTRELQLAMIPHAVTLLLEGQGYILAMFATWVHGHALIKPGSVGATSHLQGWAKGLARSLWLYVLVAITLAIAAVYEAIEVILIVPHLIN